MLVGNVGFSKVVGVAIGLASMHLLVGCLNVAQLQEADTVAKGDFDFGMGGSYTGYAVDSLEETDGLENIGVGALILWGRYGISEQLEAHANLWLPFGYSVGAKYQLVGNRKEAGPALSLGADVSMVSITVGSDSTETKTRYIDVIVPVYTGYRINEGTAFYLTPKYVLRSQTGDFSGTGHAAGGTLGATLGEDTRFHIEGTLIRDFSIESNITNFALGVTF